EATGLVAKHFGDVPERDVPERPPFYEPPPDRERRSDHVDPLAPLPALAIGYRLPDPDSDLHGYTRAVLLASLLSEGDASGLPSRLVHRDAIVTDIGAGCGLFSSYDARDPDTMTVTAVYPSTVDIETVLAAIDEEIAAVARDGVS